MLDIDGWELVAILYFAGISLILLEIFLPGLILGILGLVALIGSCYVAYLQGGLAAGLGVFIASFVGVFLSAITAFNLLPLTPMARRWMPRTAITVVSNPLPEVKVGQQGLTVTQLRPVGKAKFGDRVHEVESSLGYIEAGAGIKVVRVENTRIIVSRL